MKSKQINIRLNEETLKLLEEKCKAINTNKSKYIKKLILGNRITINNSKEDKKLINEFKRIGNNLNQIAKVLNIANKRNNLNNTDYSSMFDELIIIKHFLNDLIATDTTVES